MSAIEIIDIRNVDSLISKRLINPIFLRHDEFRYASHIT